MKKNELVELIKRKQSFLCVGLDSELDKIPACIKELDDPQFEFNKRIFDATVEFAPVYKINTAFYESQGVKGWTSLTKTLEYIRNSGEEVFVIADAKRGDIGNTSTQYARAFFDKKSSGLDFDAITVAPYMGIDSVKPFLCYESKWAIILALTSNTGADDFQTLKTTNDEKLIFEHVISKSKLWGNIDNTMYVVGATRAEMLKQIRKHLPEHFLLIPGVGAQGGSLSEVVKFGINSDIGLIVNASRSIIFASAESDFDLKAREEAMKIQVEMKDLLFEHKII